MVVTENMQISGPNSPSAFSLIEANIATAMVGMFVSAIMMMNSNLLGVLKSAKETASASQALQERVEQMRIANWVQITNASYVASNLLNTGTSSATGLAGYVETMTISPTSGTGTSAKVTRSGNTVTVNSSNSALANEKLVRVDVQFTWQGSPDRRSRTRVTTALIAKGGITK